MKIQYQTQLLTNQSKYSNCKQREKKKPLTHIGKSVTKSLQDSSYVTKNPNKKPWLNENGSLKSDKEITRLGKSWNAQTWEEYLNFSIGTLEDEELVFFSDMNSEVINKGNDLLEQLREIQHYPVTQLAFELAIEDLKPLEKIIINKSFWEDLSSRELANELETSAGNIRVIKSRALNKLKKILTSKNFKRKLEKRKLNQNRDLEGFCNTFVTLFPKG